MTKNRSSNLTSLGISVGTEAHHVKTITEADVMPFAEVSGDFSPVDISSDFAKKDAVWEQDCPWNAGRGINIRGYR